MTGIYINRISLIANGEKLPEGMWKASSIPAVPNLAKPGCRKAPNVQGAFSLPHII